MDNVGRSIFLVLVLSLLGCAQLHNVHITEFETINSGSEPFEIIVDEAGFSSDEAMSLVQESHKKSNFGQSSESIESLRAILALSQFGPKTGNPVFYTDYLDEIEKKILEKCPSGKVINLVSIRETRKSIIVSSEVVRIHGVCLK